MRTHGLMVFAILLVGSVVAGCGGGAATAPSAPSGNAQAVEGQKLVEQKCKMCHSLDRIYQKQADKAAWDQTVTRMQSKGLVLTDAEKTAVLEYLSTKGSAQ